MKEEAAAADGAFADAAKSVGGVSAVPHRHPASPAAWTFFERLPVGSQGFPFLLHLLQQPGKLPGRKLAVIFVIQRARKRQRIVGADGCLAVTYQANQQDTVPGRLHAGNIVRRDSVT